MEKHVQEQASSPVDGRRPAEGRGKDNTHLHRGLKARHITMIAIGGAIGVFGSASQIHFTLSNRLG